MLIQRIYLISFLANGTIKKIEGPPVSTTRHWKNLQNTTWTSLLQCLGILLLYFFSEKKCWRGAAHLRPARPRPAIWPEWPSACRRSWSSAAGSRSGRSWFGWTRSRALQPGPHPRWSACSLVVGGETKIQHENKRSRGRRLYQRLVGLHRHRRRHPHPVWSCGFWSRWQTSPAPGSAGSPWRERPQHPARSSSGCQPWPRQRRRGPRGPHQWRGRPRAAKRNRGSTHRSRCSDRGLETCRGRGRESLRREGGREREKGKELVGVPMESDCQQGAEGGVATFPWWIGRAVISTVEREKTV